MFALFPFWFVFPPFPFWPPCAVLPPPAVFPPLAVFPPPAVFLSPDPPSLSPLPSPGFSATIVILIELSAAETSVAAVDPEKLTNLIVVSPSLAFALTLNSKVPIL